jgi:U4/U6.U5 tri-snRNP component SNU23
LEAEADAASQKRFSTAIVERDKLDLKRSRAGNELNFNNMVGKSMVVTSNTPMAQGGGFYCTVCECVVKDSISWLDHINGKKHNRALGMNLRVERSSLEDVQSRLATHKPSDRRAAAKAADGSATSALDELDARIEKLKQEEELQIEARKEKKRQKKGEAEAEKKAGLADGFEEMMGFGGFGGKKK